MVGLDPTISDDLGYRVAFASAPLARHGRVKRDHDGHVQRNGAEDRGLATQREIAVAVPQPDHTVTVTWADGVTGTISLTPFLAKGGVFAGLRDPAWFVREMRVMRGGIGLTWPGEVDFSADGLRRDAFPQEHPDKKRGTVATAA